MATRTKHTTIRLSEQGEARLQRLALLHGSQVAAMEAALDREMRAVFNPASDAPDAVLENIRKHLKMALGSVEGEFERRTEAADREEDE